MTATEWVMTEEEAAQVEALMRAKPGDPGTLTREAKAVPIGDRSLLDPPDPARLAAVAVLSAAGVRLDGTLDLDAAAEAMRRELGVARGAE